MAELTAECFSLVHRVSGVAAVLERRVSRLAVAVDTLRRNQNKIQVYKAVDLNLLGAIGGAIGIGAGGGGGADEVAFVLQFPCNPAAF